MENSELKYKLCMYSQVYCDFHGHSRKKNIFMYGCKDNSGSNIEQVYYYYVANLSVL